MSSNAHLRKIKKPLIERRRRERINECLTQLKTLVLEAMNKDESRYSKMEKADILEMTVSHLRAVQHQISSASGPNPSLSLSAQSRGQYLMGYSECSQAVRQYLSTSSVDEDLDNTPSSLRQFSGYKRPLMSPEEVDVRVSDRRLGLCPSAHEVPEPVNPASRLEMRSVSSNDKDGTMSIHFPVVMSLDSEGNVVDLDNHVFQRCTKMYTGNADSSCHVLPSRSLPLRTTDEDCSQICQPRVVDNDQLKELVDGFPSHQQQLIGPFKSFNILRRELNQNRVRLNTEKMQRFILPASKRTFINSVDDIRTSSKPILLSFSESVHPLQTSFILTDCIKTDVWRPW